jgi:hypothetical protein
MKEYPLFSYIHILLSHFITFCMNISMLTKLLAVSPAKRDREISSQILLFLNCGFVQNCTYYRDT